jgi:hypothetical protein
MSDLRLAIRSLRSAALRPRRHSDDGPEDGANAAISACRRRCCGRCVANADRLVFVWNTYGSMLAQASVSIPDFLDRKTQAPSVRTPPCYLAPPT